MYKYVQTFLSKCIVEQVKYYIIATLLISMAYAMVKKKEGKEKNFYINRIDFSYL